MSTKRRASPSKPPFPDGVISRQSSLAELAYCASECQGKIFLCRSFFAAGVPLSTPGFIKLFLFIVDLAPCQINANTYQIMMCFINLYKSRGWSLSMSEVVYAYNLFASKGGACEYHLESRSSRKLFWGAPDLDKWKMNPVILSGEFGQLKHWQRMYNLHLIPAGLRMPLRQYTEMMIDPSISTK